MRVFIKIRWQFCYAIAFIHICNNPIFKNASLRQRQHSARCIVNDYLKTNF